MKIDSAQRSKHPGQHPRTETKRPVSLNAFRRARRFRVVGDVCWAVGAVAAVTAGAWLAILLVPAIVLMLVGATGAV